MTDKATATGTPALMRAINDRAALAIMLQGQPLSRNQLSELSSVSKPTASQIVKRLETAGLIESVGKIAGTSGPTTSLYGVRADRVLGVAIDVQSDRVLSTPVDAVGGTFEVAESLRSPDGRSRSARDELEGAVAAACELNGVDIEAVAAISVGLQASVSPRTDELFLAHRLSGWPLRGTREALEAQLPWSVELFNDANLAAVAERATGAGSGVHSFALLWLSVGLGFAVDLDGQLLFGARGAAGEIGRLRVPADSLGAGETSVLLDDILDWSSLEAMASRHGIRGASIVELAGALAGHPNREAFFAELAPRVALAVPPALAVLDPELIILGGPIGAAGGPCLADLVRDLLSNETEPSQPITGATVIANPVLAGARHALAETIRSRLLDQAFSSAHRLR